MFYVFPVTAISQQKKTEQEQLLILPSSSVRLDSLNSIMARELGFVLSFNAGKINPAKKINFPRREINLKEVLFYLSNHYGLAHKRIGNHIILYSDNYAGKEAQATTKVHKDDSFRTKPDIPDEQKKAAILLPKETKPFHLTILPDIGKPISFRNLTVAPPSYFKRKMIPFPEKQDNNEKQKSTNKVRFSKKNNRLYASAGFAASEIFYAHPQIKVGMPWLFAIAGWETNLQTSGFSYGLGAIIKRFDSWDFQLSVSKSVFSKEFRWRPSASDTLLRIKTGLTQINLLSEKHLSDKWVLSFGPVINFIKNKYFLKDPFVTNPLPAGVNSHYILRPPYTLSENYDEHTSSGKIMWIGFQIGLFYIF